MLKFVVMKVKIYKFCIDESKCQGQSLNNFDVEEVEEMGLQLS